MKKKAGVAIVSVLLLASAFYAITQQTVLDTAGPTAAVPARVQPFPLMEMDPNTGVILADKNSGVDLTALNSPEQIQARQLALLALTNPVAYAKLYPKTAEQLKAEEAAWFSISQPEAYEAIAQKLKTPEQLAAEAKAAFAIEHPVEYHQLIVKERGIEVTPEETAALQAIGATGGN